jgi:hypothetical protein
MAGTSMFGREVYIWGTSLSEGCLVRAEGGCDDMLGNVDGQAGRRCSDKAERRAG